ncbi:hypothetical protein F511_35310 [Dorcoceras hygrometricum]|uniref:Uncharacterized protein n=1 Tax=Dorcoceras hygrometricum TaxID=472368 RepID=A0A2Z7AD31_9LAMI|nr:hypothetical protein F511_35310 [Dorcoceras hygrometricum]
MLSAVEREIFVRVLHQSMSDRVSCWYFNRCILVGSSSNADVDFSRWCFSCDGQQRALRDSEATTFCEQEPAVGCVSVFRSGLCIRFVGTPFVVIVAQNIEDTRASGNTALSSPCWDLLATMRRVVNYHSSWVGSHHAPSGNPGFTAGRGFNPAGGASGGG